MLVMVANANYKRAVLDSSIKLSCDIHNNDQVEWRFNDDAIRPIYWIQILEVRYRHKMSVSQSHTFNNLTIYNLQMSDTNVYKCVKNGGYGDERVFEVIVINGSAINSTLNITVGDSIELTCPFNSTEWAILVNDTFVPILVHNMSHLHIKTIYNTSTYFCFENYRHYSISVVVYNKPLQQQLSYHLHIIVGGMLLVALVTAIVIVCIIKKS